MLLCTSLQKPEQNTVPEKQTPSSTEGKRGGPDGRAPLVSLARSADLKEITVVSKSTETLQTQVPTAGARPFSAYSFGPAKE
jgi:hypothetical protein